ACGFQRVLHSLSEAQRLSLGPNRLERLGRESAPGGRQGPLVQEALERLEFSAHCIEEGVGRAKQARGPFGVPFSGGERRKPLEAPCQILLVLHLARQSDAFAKPGKRLFVPAELEGCRT